jgi:glucan phosphoethanolaminetransferase (alkaline phosphatase superfamily)
MLCYYNKRADLWLIPTLFNTSTLSTSPLAIFFDRQYLVLVDVCFSASALLWPLFFDPAATVFSLSAALILFMAFFNLYMDQYQNWY